MKTWIPIGVALFLLTGCLKNNNKCEYSDSTVMAPAAEQQALEDSLNFYGIQATKDPAGFYFKINEPGANPKVKNLCSTIIFFYKGAFFSGKVFDSTQNDPVVYPLRNLIVGWQKGIPLIGSGGSIDLYIPPSLGYGPEDLTDSGGKVVMPGNSYLVFHVELAGVQ